MNTALARKSIAEMYSGNETETDSRTPVMIGAVIPATRDVADAMPVALPLVISISLATGQYFGLTGKLPETSVA